MPYSMVENTNPKEFCGKEILPIRVDLICINLCGLTFLLLAFFFFCIFACMQIFKALFFPDTVIFCQLSAKEAL